ncbi:MAG TPA: UDP-N-acetylmuramate dehydrogenase, partial [Anaerolineae bacterium]
MGQGLASLRLAIAETASENELLARHTTFRIGGPADLWVEAKQISDLINWVGQARRNAVPVFVLGNGSNVLVLDKGIRGLVIENHCDGVELKLIDPDRAVLHAESGASLPLVANRLARQGWSGLEWAIGIPGTIGGAVVGNAGAHGSSMADHLLVAAVLDAHGTVHELPKTDLGFGYRQSRFKHSRREIILTADFELNRTDSQGCIARMNEYTAHRRRTQPTEASVGSMFKNPPGDFAGRLIELAGLKETRVGNVEVSPVHANFFVNHGGATARDVMELIETVRRRVREK